MYAGKLSTPLTIVVSRLELPLTLAHIIGDRPSRLNIDGSSWHVIVNGVILLDPYWTARSNEKVTRGSQHFGVLTINSADDYLDSADDYLDSADDYLDSADDYLDSADDYLDSADDYLDSADDYLDSADDYLDSADDYLDSADALVKERSADGLRAADRFDGKLPNDLEADREGCWFLVVFPVVPGAICEVEFVESRYD
ncbi:hypothetical protein F511_01816 [Dorcoceras hygrometricum]|uniref:Uncharacterized protein n=1 Tax=Dorcoceras hygrometricum TaxID=472368 RepID=A0A2Z7AR12_9LAMI|nr:hypothetical protein F511_01816 [Dorcoceras hygrometricum]